jgi:hypothetical protein
MLYNIFFSVESTEVPWVVSHFDLYYFSLTKFKIVYNNRMYHQSPSKGKTIKIAKKM